MQFPILIILQQNLNDFVFNHQGAIPLEYKSLFSQKTFHALQVDFNNVCASKKVGQNRLKCLYSSEALK
jgi:hypothetical protein